MKIAIALFFALFCLYSAEKFQIVVQLKSVEDAPKLLSLALSKSLNFDSVLPQNNAKREKTETLSRLERYFFAQVEENQKEQIQKEILDKDFIEAAWIHGESQLPVDKVQLPNYQSRQIYLNKPPAGVDMESVFNKPHGRGDLVTVVDLEGGWDFDHVDLKDQKGRVIHGSQSPLSAWKDHGSAVLGEIAGVDNGFGVTGISSKSKVFGASIYNERGQQDSVAKAIVAAADFLKKGDILLIELHRVGPRGNFIAMEWWPDNFDAMKYATEKGVIVIEAGGNGNQNLDHPDYNKPQPGFPRTWKNPFNRTLADSGTIIVGAGAPPPGTNGRDHGPDRSRLGFSNYGQSVDAQGWGREVVTIGYGDLYREGADRNKFYTAVFSGTSSASPIVVGVVSAVQSYAKGKGKQLGPKEWREFLRKTGTSQTDAPGRPKTERIGNRPNIKQLTDLVDQF